MLDEKKQEYCYKTSLWCKCKTCDRVGIIAHHLRDREQIDILDTSSGSDSLLNVSQSKWWR